MTRNMLKQSADDFRVGEQPCELCNRFGDNSPVLRNANIEVLEMQAVFERYKANKQIAQGKLYRLKDKAAELRKNR